MPTPKKAKTTFPQIDHRHQNVESILRQQAVTLVIPCMNEEGNIERLFNYINQTFQLMGYVLPVILIDDGNTDDTPKILREMSQKYSFLTVIHHPTNRGVAEVWNTALAYVKTEWILWGQPNLASDPRIDIPALLEAYEPGVDAIGGWSQGRSDGKLGAASLANKACRWAFGLQIHDTRWIKLVRRDILAKLPATLVTHRDLLAVLAGQGYNVIEPATPWHPRFLGMRKFGKKRLLMSMVNFIRVLGWFFLIKPINVTLWYVNAFLDAIEVGFRAAYQAFQLKTSRDAPTISHERGRRNQPLRANASVTSIAYYRRLALSKVAV